MKFTKEIISESLNKCDNLLDKMLILSLYNEYLKVKESNKDNNRHKLDFKISDIKIACDRIMNEIDIKRNTVSNNPKMKESINLCIILLHHYLKNYKIDDKQKNQELIDIITVVEGYLCISLSFPENAERCLCKTLERVNTEDKIK